MKPKEEIWTEEGGRSLTKRVNLARFKWGGKEKVVMGVREKTVRKEKLCVPWGKQVRGAVKRERIK